MNFCDMTDEEICTKANHDRAEDLGRYGMTGAMREEQRRANRRHPAGYRQIGRCQIWDED